MNKPEKSRRAGEKGAVAVLVAVLLLFLIGMVALVVDVGYLYATRSELQNAADAAALAGARQLGFLYEEMSHGAQKAYDCGSCSAIVAAATDFKNQAGGVAIEIQPADVEVGRWKDKTFTPTTAAPNAVRVSASRVAGNNGPLLTFFAGLFGKESFDVRAQAVAALTAQSTGNAELPVGFATAFFDRYAGDDYCGEDIKFYPAGEASCAGWHVFNEKASSAETLRNVLDTLNPQKDVKGNKRVNIPNPIDLGTGPEFNFTEGNLTAAFGNMKDLFDTKKDPVTGQWETNVVVFLGNDCKQINNLKQVVGFASVVITQVLEAPEKEIKGKIICKVEEGRGGGGEEYGSVGSVPGLVR